MTYTIAISKHTTITAPTFLGVIMRTAYWVRNAAAHKYACPASEIVFGECLSMAWGVRANIKAVEDAPEITPVDFSYNDEGFVYFRNRNFRRAGDKKTWARYNATTRQLTICLAAHGLMSDEYRAEIAAFASAHGIDFDAMRCGERQSITL